MSTPLVQPFIIDGHVHIGTMADFYMPDNSLECMVRVMDARSIKAVIVSHIVGLMTNHFEYAHAETRKAVEAFPGRIYGFAEYNPHFPKESLEVMKAHLAMKGFVGVKIHPAGHRYPLDGEAYTPLWEYASENGTPVLTHTWDATPQATYPFELVPMQENARPALVGRVADRYPTLPIIMAHSGGHYQGHLQAIEVVRAHRHVYVDICGETIGYGLIEWFVKEIGAGKMLFASDMNWLDPRAHISRVLGAKISAEDKEMIFFRNACSLFKLQ